MDFRDTTQAARGESRAVAVRFEADHRFGVPREVPRIHPKMNTDIKGGSAGIYEPIHEMNLSLSHAASQVLTIFQILPEAWRRRAKRTGDKHFGGHGSKHQRGNRRLKHTATATVSEQADRGQLTTLIPKKPKVRRVAYPTPFNARIMMIIAASISPIKGWRLRVPSRLRACR
jgi:hypothetical protein